MPTFKTAFRFASEDDLCTIADIHLLAYSRKHFTSRLNRDTLINYYRYFLHDGAKTLLIFEIDSSGNEILLGFSVFGYDIGKKISSFKRRNMPSILRSSLKSPFTAGRKFLAQLKTRITQGRAMSPANFLLLSIAVRKSGYGYGAHLLEETLNIAKSYNEDFVGLYVNIENITAINSYIKSGFFFKQLYGNQYYMEHKN